MPSKSYGNFLHMRSDVDKLMEIHNYFCKSTKGKKSLGHITRSGIIMLCAAWERYNEDVLLESIKYICDNITDINLLNKKIKQKISKDVKSDPNEIKAIELSGDGWKKVWYKYAEEETEKLHTPKTSNLNKLFIDYLGIDEYSKIWIEKYIEKIDEFIQDRGEIAHNGNQAKYITIKDLRKYYDIITSNVIEIDSQLSWIVKKQAITIKLPWIQNYSRNLK